MAKPTEDGGKKGKLAAILASALRIERALANAKRSPIGIAHVLQNLQAAADADAKRAASMLDMLTSMKRRQELRASVMLIGKYSAPLLDAEGKPETIESVGTIAAWTIVLRGDEATDLRFDAMRAVEPGSMLVALNGAALASGRLGDRALQDNQGLSPVLQVAGPIAPGRCLQFRVVAATADRMTW